MSRPRFVDSPADLPSPQEIGRVIGLDFIRGMLDGSFPAPPIARTLNFGVDQVDRGKVVFRGTPDFAVMNPIGTVHGGWFGALLDSCMSCAVQTCLPAGQGYTTLEYKVSMLRPLFADSADVLAIGSIVHIGRRTGVAEGRIVGAEDDRVYATGSATCLVFDLPK
ncbi:MAG: PaaI family thioesterase [Pseudomonadota bacterium]